MTSLPDDVLYDIFHRITVDAQTRSRSEGGVMIEPLSSSHVCRRWRQVALSRGTLWSYLCIDHFCGPRRRRRMLAIFRTWLERTRKAPLNFSISFRLRSGENIEGHRKMESVVKSLVAEQQRWKDVRFGWQFMASSEFTIKLTDMPMLSSIALCTSVQRYDGVEIVPHIGIARSQQLEHMELGGRHTCETGEDPIHSLRRVVRKVPNAFREVEGAEHCLAILKACPNLADFRAEFHPLTFPVIPDQTLSETRFVHNVRTLTIQDGKGTVAASHLVDKLTLPELTYLKLYSSYSLIVEHHMHVLLGFMERSRPRLEKLEISGLNALSCILIPVLRMLPTLHELVVFRCDDADELFEGLTRSGDGPITCPKLRYIHLHDWDFIDRYGGSLDALYLMAKSRGDGTAVLGTATFHNRMKLPISRICHEHDNIRDNLVANFDDLCIDLMGE